MDEPPIALDGGRSVTASALADPDAGVSGLTRGDVIAGKYRLERYLARGGMAEVWLAKHEELRSDVAIKFVSLGLARDSQAAPHVLDRFRFEARISAKLAALTRNVVSVHDAGLHNDIPYLVMEYIPGPTLDAEVDRKGPLDPEFVADVLDQTAQALEAAHSLGIVHRDLKPSNLMLLTLPDGGFVVKVADFGVAKATRGSLAFDRPRETAAGDIVGSPAFMSPEQIRGTTEVDARSDIWSLGVVAYEVLTGRQCFDGDTASDCLVSVLSKQVVPPSRLRPALPRALDAWFERVLAKEPDGRFSSAREAAGAFRIALASAPRRRRMGALMVGGALCVAAGVGMMALLGARSRSAAAPRSPAASASTGAALPAAPAPPSDPSSAAAQATASASRPRGASARAHEPVTRPAGTSGPRGPAEVPAPTTAIPPAPTAAETVAPTPPPASARIDPPPKKKKIDPSEIQ